MHLRLILTSGRGENHLTVGVENLMRSLFQQHTICLFMPCIEPLTVYDKHEEVYNRLASANNIHYPWSNVHDL
ncbi:hypothetical protein XELAEV_18024714mg [Xenopus laevis]|uniref:Uncharacterized protein n=1 Tax=Xenopus laevis TaxID=8355 RepID=A0A974HLN5_XENLA|nr:hypothetical protein XELAEV_18024714mg [Xenopus laevis]